MSDLRQFRVVCPDGVVVIEDLTYDEAVAIAQEFDIDTDAHFDCVGGHVVEMYAGWVPVSTTRPVTQ